LENWSYDGLFGYIPTANGLHSASNTAKTQVDLDGKPYTTLPQVDPQLPQNLSNGPFDLSPYINDTSKTIDLTHAFYTEQYQINDGKMNQFVSYGNAKGLTMSNYDVRKLYLGQLAMNYTLFDNWFHGAFGGSFLNHYYLISASIPVYPNPPWDIVNVINETTGKIVDINNELMLTPDHYAVNTMVATSPPHPSWANMSRLLPPQNATNIGDLLTEKNISWRWYSGGYNDAMNGNASQTYQFHHQPFVYFSNYSVGSPGREHLKDETDLLNDIAKGTLPQVSFYKPLGEFNMHPEYSIIGGSSDKKIKEIVEKIKNSPYWSNTVIFITFDEHGGRWDHVAPPKKDRFGPGSRVGCICVSPLCKKGYVESNYYDSTAILKFIEDRFELRNLSQRDAMQLSMDSIFENSRPNDPGFWIVFAVIGGAVVIGIIIVLIIALLQRNTYSEIN